MCPASERFHRVIAVSSRATLKPDWRTCLEALQRQDLKVARITGTEAAQHSAVTGLVRNARGPDSIRQLEGMADPASDNISLLVPSQCEPYLNEQAQMFRELCELRVTALDGIRRHRRVDLAGASTQSLQIASWRVHELVLQMARSGCLTDKDFDLQDSAWEVAMGAFQAQRPGFGENGSSAHMPAVRQDVMASWQQSRPLLPGAATMEAEAQRAKETKESERASYQDAERRARVREAQAREAREREAIARESKVLQEKAREAWDRAMKAKASGDENLYQGLVREAEECDRQARDSWQRSMHNATDQGRMLKECEQPAVLDPEEEERQRQLAKQREAEDREKLARQEKERKRLEERRAWELARQAREREARGGASAAGGPALLPGVAAAQPWSQTPSQSPQAPHDASWQRQQREEEESRLRQAQDREMREREMYDRQKREREALERDARDREARENQAREQAARERQARDMEARQFEAREQEAREREAHAHAAREQEFREREARERQFREQESREREAREREARERQAREQEARERDAREREAQELHAQEARQREQYEAQELHARQERERQAAMHLHPAPLPVTGEGTLRLQLPLPDIEVAKFLSSPQSGIAQRSGVQLTASFVAGNTPVLEVLGTPATNAVACFLVQKELWKASLLSRTKD
eukprot:TRINITY_DN15764_c0_g1_i1.p1 TRINITY_DN15764_c0_g1~~TRINITY_DN15764_c0_g1_i1.p1  ORF type:complete len:672 (+),score=170.08 TRINITY_DN15764_c0_g1_i1:31-2016(+)